MFLALRDLRRGARRFVLLGVVIALVGLLSTVLSGLATGLVTDGISGLRALPMDRLAFQDGSDATFSRSTLRADAVDAFAKVDGVQATPLGASFVNAASTAALAGLPCGAAYSASKGGVLAMSRSIAIEYAKRGVRVNCVCPGEIKTGMTDAVQFPASMDFELISRVVSPTGARGPEVVAGVIAMLASEDGIHITGEAIRVDGGTLA